MNEKSVALPTADGRTSVHSNALYTSLEGYELPDINLDFHRPYLDTLYYEGFYDRYFAKGINNLMLANTDQKISFSDKIKPKEAEAMLNHLKTKRESWFLGGYEVLEIALLRELVLGGAISAEAVISKGLKGIDVIDFVRLKDIYIARNKKTNKDVVFQKPSNAIIPQGYNALLGIELGKGYSYIPLQRNGNNPYGIPPLLAALEDLGVHRDMMKSFSAMTGKLGLFGLFMAMIKPLSPSQSEQMEIQNKGESLSYQQRALKYIQSFYDKIKGQLPDGIAIGFKDTHEFDLKGKIDGANAQNLVDIVADQLFAGILQDPNLMGKPRSSTEAFVKVILKVFLEQLQMYQKAKASFWERVYYIELIFAGFNPIFVKVEYDKVNLSDGKAENEAKKIEFETLQAMYNEGLVSRQYVAQQLGLDAPFLSDKDLQAKKASEVPKQAPAPATSSNNFEFLKNSFTYPYDKKRGLERYKEIQNSSFTVLSDSNDSLEKFINNYASDLDPYYKSFESKAKKQCIEKLSKKKKISQEELVSTTIIALAKTFESEFKDKISPKVKTNVTKCYKAYRKDKSVFSYKSNKYQSFKDSDIPDSILSLLDYKTIEFLQNSDNLYLGKFMTDPETIERFRKKLIELYLYEGGELGGDSEALNSMFDEFFTEVAALRWKLRQIIETTLNNARAYSTILYMQQAEIEKFERIEVMDRKTCVHCQNLNGRIFTVSNAVNRIEKIASSDPENIADYSVFGTSIPIKDLEKLTDSEIEAKGIGFGSVHPHCRGMVVAVQ